VINVPSDIRSTVDSFNHKTLDSFNRVDQIVRLGAPALPILLEYLSSQSANDQWAAIVVLPQIARSTPIERPRIISALKLYQDNNESLEFLAAAQLAGLGEGSGLGGLINNLNNKNILSYGEPPQQIGELALLYLNNYVADAKLIDNWNDWWEENQDNLQWQSAQEQFVVINLR
jgi:hypothetical protein